MEQVNPKNVVKHSDVQKRMFKKFGGCMPKSMRDDLGGRMNLQNDSNSCISYEQDDSVEKTIALFNSIVMEKLKHDDANSSDCK